MVFTEGTADWLNFIFIGKCDDTPVAATTTFYNPELELIEIIEKISFNWITGYKIHIQNYWQMRSK